MAYENILFNEQNMVVDNGYFYFLDYTRRMLSQKLSNGTTAFQFPIDIPNSFANYVVNGVKCLQYDGYSFWSMQDFTDGTGIIIRQWVINNFVCVMINQIPKVTDQYYTYRSSTFSVEHYNTKLSSDFYDRDTIVKIAEYSDVVVYEGTVLGIGPNKYGLSETVTVSGTIGLNIYLSTPLINNYFEGDPVTITSSILIFNDYFYKDTQGSLITLNPYTGDILSIEGDVEYDDIKASKFTRLKGILRDHPDINTLAYVKGTSLKLRDMSDLYRYKADVRASDTFDGEDFSVPDESKWYIDSGDPKIYNNKLFCSTVGAGHDSITSNYNLLGDFSLQVSGTVGDITVFSGSNISNNFHHYMGFTFADDTTSYKYGLSYMGQYISPYILPILHLKFLGNALDSSGNAHDGTLAGSPTLTTGVDGVSNSAYYFNGANYVTVSNTADLEVGKNNADFSVVFWLKLISAPINSYQSITHKGTADNTRTFSIWRIPNENKFHCRISTSYNYNEGLNTLSAVSLNVWTLIAYVKENNTLSVYLNGVLDNTATLIGTVVSNTGNICIGRSFWTTGPTSHIDNYRIYLNVVSEEELLHIVATERDGFIEPENVTAMVVKHGNFKAVNILASGIPQLNYSYNIKAEKTDNNLYFSYRTLTSGIFDMPWQTTATIDIHSLECMLSLGLSSNLITVSGSYFENLECTKGYLRYPVGDYPYYGIMNMDNVQTNQSTLHTIYGIDIDGDNLYRLQKTATYFGTNYSWNTYNFQISPIRSFIDFITVDSDTHILPATGRNTTVIRSITLDQYGQGVVNRPVTFIDDDDIGFITTEVVKTDLFYGTGKANTAYTSGTDLRVVTITAEVTQLD